MAHIVIDARTWNTSTGRYVRELTYELEKLDHANHYTLLMYPKDVDDFTPTNPAFSKLGSPYKEFSWAEQTGLKKQLNGLKPDLVHFPMVQQPVWYRGKTVTTINDLTTIRFDNPSKQALVFKFKQQVYKWVNKRVVKKAQAILTFTDYVKDDILKHVGGDPAKFHTTYLAADPIKDAPEPVKGLENAQFIMYVGRPMPHKNLPRLVEAFQSLKSQHPELKLVLAGKLDDNYLALQKDVQAKQIANIVFTDFISDGQLRWLYKRCAAYIFPSLSEGFGLPGLEAAAHGTPVVCSNASCLPEVYGDGAHYFDPLNVQSMADAINEVLTDKTLRQELITKGLAQAARYSWQKCAQQTIEIYNQVLTEG